MTYQIYYKDRKNTLFDIEFFMKINENAKGEDDKWYLELHSSSFISGAIEFIREELRDDQIKNFTRDCEVLEELRGWLWEKNNNKPTSMKEANKRKSILGKQLKEGIYKFANHWGLYVNED